MSEENERRPEIVLPSGFRDKSGLYLPTTLGPVFQQAPIPPELEPRPGLLIAGEGPSFFEQVYTYATERELGLEPTGVDDVLAITRAIKFWPSMRFLARFQRDLWSVDLDPEGQIALLHVWFAGSKFASHAERWVRQGPQRVLFSQQQVFALQRLVLLNARDGEVDEDHTQDEYVALLAALIAIPDAILGAEIEIEVGGDPTSLDDERWMRLFIGHGGFVGRGALRNELGRAFRLYSEIASSDDMKDHRDYCPLDEWFVDEFGLSFVELEAVGFALHAGSKMLDEQEPPVLVDERYFRTTLLADKARTALDALSAPRDWYVERFQRTQESHRRAAFEITPFLQRPALRQPDGQVMPLGPRALSSWLGATGNYYRLFDIARSKGSSTRKRFTRFNGALVEAYVAETAARAYPARPPHETIWLPGSVYGEQLYAAKGGQRRTPDVAIDLTPDLVLIEVTASRLTEKSVVDADPDAVREDIEKVVTDKIQQLGNAIADLRLGVAALPHLDIQGIERIWPIVVSSEGIFQTPTLWAYIKEAVESSLAQPKVQPLTLLDLEDVEELFGFVVDGAGLIEVLQAKTADWWRERELAAWLRGSGTDCSDHSPISREQLNTAVDDVAHVLFGADLVSAYQNRQADP